MTKEKPLKFEHVGAEACLDFILEATILKFTIYHPYGTGTIFVEYFIILTTVIYSYIEIKIG